MIYRIASCCLLLLAATGNATLAQEPTTRLRLLFLGDEGPHQAARRADELLPALAERGIDVTYTNDVDGTLNRQRLSKVDGLIVYANIDKISDEQADALLAYVADVSRIIQDRADRCSGHFEPAIGHAAPNVGE
jgi:hypothetical protein